MMEHRKVSYACVWVWAVGLDCIPALPLSSSTSLQAKELQLCHYFTN